MRPQGLTRSIPPADEEGGAKRRREIVFRVPSLSRARCARQPPRQRELSAGATARCRGLARRFGPHSFRKMFTYTFTLTLAKQNGILYNIIRHKADYLTACTALHHSAVQSTYKEDQA